MRILLLILVTLTLALLCLCWSLKITGSAMFYRLRSRVESFLWEQFAIDISYANLSARRYDRRHPNRCVTRNRSEAR